MDEFLDLFLSLVRKLLHTGVLAFHGRDHRLQLLLHELSLDVANFLGFFVDAESSAHLSVLSVNDGQSLLKLVLVDLNLRKVGVDNRHGVLAGSGEGHHVVPVLKDELVAHLADLFLLNGDVTVLNTSPEESPSRDGLSSVEGRALVDVGQVTVPDVSLAVEDSELI